MPNEDNTPVADAATDRVTARDAAAGTAPVLASDPRSLTVDRGAVEAASTGAAEDAAAAERAEQEAHSDAS